MIERTTGKRSTSGRASRSSRFLPLFPGNGLYDRMRKRWEKASMGQFVALTDQDYAGPFPTIQAALTAARERFSKTPYSVIRVGARVRKAEVF